MNWELSVWQYKAPVHYIISLKKNGVREAGGDSYLRTGGHCLAVCTKARIHTVISASILSEVRIRGRASVG